MQFMEFLLVMVLLAKDTLKNSQEKENAPIQKQKALRNLSGVTKSVF